jgi:tetratricopeptide (TPR) repeat protein
MDAFEQALAHHAQGRLGEAEALYRGLLQQQPESPLLHANLGEALRALGRHDEARVHLLKAIELDASIAEAWNSLGLLARDQRRYGDAEAAYREVIRLQPQFIGAYINLGAALVARYRRVEAVEVLRSALLIEPDNPEALTRLGSVLCEVGDARQLDQAEAVCRRALAVAPHFPQASDSLGHVLQVRGQHDLAIECYKRSLSLNARRVEPRRRIGHLLQHSQRFDLAARFFESAGALDPRDPGPHADLGSLWFMLGNHDEAVRHYRSALRNDPDYAEAHHGLGVVLVEQRRLDEAEACLREALRLDPRMALSWLVLARIQAERGEFDVVCQSARAALAILPDLAGAYSRLAVTLKARMPAAEIQAMETLLDRDDLSVHGRSELHFGLAVIFDARGLHAQAAAHLEPANALQCIVKARRGIVNDASGHSRYIERIISSFTPALVASGRTWGDPDPRPVFVVGLPRTGTTLVEQILASHPKIHGAGELHDFPNVFFAALPRLIGNPTGDPFDALAELGPVTAKAAARCYLDRLESLAPAKAARIVDKTPDNIKLLGLIALLLRGARVIICSRDLRDVAVSCWLTNFETNPWTNQWEHIAQRFTDHERLMEHWRRTRPLEWLDVSYEELVADVAGHARSMLDFLGLEWSPACASFHMTRRVVGTASLVQVRQPVSRDSVGRWKNYRTMLQPLFQALERQGTTLNEDD